MPSAFAARVIVSKEKDSSAGSNCGSFFLFCGLRISGTELPAAELVPLAVPDVAVEVLAESALAGAARASAFAHFENSTEPLAISHHG
ncbi:MAG: hypothetical protein ABSE57_12245 [Bryobacteraceae bacterium]